MKIQQGRYTYAVILIVLITLGVSESAWAKKNDFQKIYFFGDSLSDPGNVYELTGETSKAPYDLIPSAPYAIKGHQFSNGKTWAQNFAKKMHAKKAGKPVLKAPGKNGNYAFGGARARLDSSSLVPSGTEQIDLYLAEHGKASKKALYVIQFGGNDVRDALEVFDPDLPYPQQAHIIIGSAVHSTLGMITTLYGHGARHFLIVNVPDISRAPAVQLAGPGPAFVAGLLSMAYNSGLDAGLIDLKLAIPKASIDRLDLYSIINSVIYSPKKYRIKNIESPCLRFFVKKGSKCRKPDTYLFWDGIHPTAAIHKLVGEQATKIY
jgi:phospholipase/lecithinase/hemolysin